LFEIKKKNKLTFYNPDGLTPEQNEEFLQSVFSPYGKIEEIGRKCIYMPEDLV